MILAALRHLPRDLPETFERILSKYTEVEDIDIGRQIFRWVTVAKRPLTVEELREAIGTKPLQEAWSDSMYINDMKKALACCGNLVFEEEEQQTVHFTHGSVKQYLLSRAVQESLSRYHVDLKKANKDAGAICVTYLNFSVFNRQMAHTTGKSISTTDITSTVVKNSLPLGKSANKIALSLLRRNDKSGKSVHRILEEAMGDTDVYRQHNILRQYSFRTYANQFWLEHTKEGIGPDSKKIWGLWCNLIEEAGSRDTLSSIPWTLEDLKKRATIVLKWIAEENHCSLAQLIIDSDVRLTQPKLLLLVEGAAKKGNVHLIKTILGSKDIVQPILDSGLQSAAGGGHLDVVKRLLQEKADVNAAAAPGSGGRTALQAAAGGGHLDVVERLLQEKTDVNAAAGSGSRTALQAAAEGGHLDVVERLLQEKANVNAAAARSGGRTALQAAAGGGHLDVVERLLQEKANVNAAAAGYGGRAALQAAAEGGHLDVVERLLQEKANVNAAADAYHGRTALQAAAGGGHLDVVERLLQEKANVNAAAAAQSGGKTALQAAAEGGHLNVVERLRAAGAK